MLLKNTREYYGFIGILLHWSIALLMIGLIGLGWYLTTINYYHPYYHLLFLIHKSFGMITLILAVFNLLWYIFNPKPKLPSGLRPIEKIAAHLMHNLLFLLTIVMPITGYFLSTSKGDGISIFNWFTVPALYEGGHPWAKLFGELHFWIGYTTATLIIFHALAAFKHEFINKDGLLRRMLGIKTKV